MGYANLDKLRQRVLQTYQADIRPVFLDDDTETATVSRSGWTGLGEFLSNEAISQRMHKSMRIQEWELRLIMEFCNKGGRLNIVVLCCSPSQKVVALSYQQLLKSLFIIKWQT